MRPTWSTAAGAVAVLLFVVGAAIAGRPPDFDASSQAIVDYLDEDRTRIQVSSALLVLAIPFLVWFLAAVSALVRDGTPARSAANLALVAGAVAGGVFLTDVAALLVGALRPESMAESPALAQALYDYSWIAPAASAPLFAAMLAALGTLGLREPALWPRWLGWAGIAAAAAYLLRTGAMFTDDGVFAADGVLGFFVPIVALLGWTLLASLLLARRGT
jgi:hypothetical protein